MHGKSSRVHSGTHLWSLACAVLLAPTCASAQDSVRTIGGFSYDAFRVNEETAHWILAYDRAAWITSDSVLAAPVDLRAQLGPEWFCLEDRGTWHALYGQYAAEPDHYRIVFHYQSVSKPSFVSSTAPLDTAQVLAFARALHRGGAAFPDTLTRSGLNFNKYIRRLADRTIEVWYLPALQANGLLAWGAEVRQVYDREGRTLIGSEVAGAGLQGRYGDTTHLLDIDERARDVPSVGAI